MCLADKPRHLEPVYGAQFEDPSVAAAYATRPPYPDSLFDALVELIAHSPRDVLELGAGSGDLSLRLAARVDRLDAVEPSPAMLAVGQRRAGSEQTRIRWIHSPAETLQALQSYSLVVAAESLHWMNWPVVMSMVERALLPGAFLAIVLRRDFTGLPWQAALPELIARYSTNRDYRAYDIVAELTSRSLFEEVGRRSSTSHDFSQDVERYIESFHSRNGLSRDRMTPSAAESFDRELRALVYSHVARGPITGTIRSDLVWGVPRAPVG